jgi:hypothetical protein
VGREKEAEREDEVEREDDVEEGRRWWDASDGVEGRLHSQCGSWEGEGRGSPCSPRAAGAVGRGRGVGLLAAPKVEFRDI